MACAEQEALLVLQFRLSLLIPTPFLPHTCYPTISLATVNIHILLSELLLILLDQILSVAMDSCLLTIRLSISLGPLSDVNDLTYESEGNADFVPHLLIGY